MILTPFWEPETEDIGFKVALSLAIVFGVLATWFVGFKLLTVPAPEPVPEEPALVEAALPEPIPADTLVAVTEEPVAAEPEYDWELAGQLMVGIYREGGGDAVCDECRVRIADVMLNRVADDRFPDTLAEVLTQKGQYGTMYRDGIALPARAAQPEEAEAVQRAYDTAVAVLTGTHSELYGEGYIYQSEFPNLGHDAFQHCGIYFAKG